MSFGAGISRAVTVALFGSGLSALTFEVVWTRWLTNVLGSTTLAVASVLAAYMAGLGIGALALGRVADRLARPVRAYALLEIGIGGLALAMPALIDVVDSAHRALAAQHDLSFRFFALLRFAGVFVLFAAPTALMGATLPTLSRAASAAGGRGLTVGLLYAANTAGAVAGTVLCGFVLIPGIGARAANTAAAGVDLAIGAGLWAWSVRRERRAAEAYAPARSPRLASPRLGRAAVVALGLSGAAALAYEVAWARMLVLVLGPSTYAFSTMLATVLAGLSIGAFAANRLLARLARPEWALAVVQIGAAAAAAAGLAGYEAMPSAYLALTKIVGGATGLALANKVALSAALMLVPTLLLGAAFPLAAALAAPEAQTRSRDVGRLYAVNTAGAVVGSFLAGFVLVPAVGMQRTVGAAIGANLAAAALLLAVAGGVPLRRRAAAAAAVMAVAAATALAPRWDPRVITWGVYRGAAFAEGLSAFGPAPYAHDRVVLYREDYNSTITVTASGGFDAPVLALRVDGKTDASDRFDMDTQLLLGLLGPALHPAPRSALVVGLASGSTAGALLADPRVRSLSIVELEASMVEASHFFDHVNGRPLADARTRLVVDDARKVLALDGPRHDVIVSEPSNPWMAGPSRLFTIEAFRAARSRLEIGGVMVQWLHFSDASAEVHVRSILRTFADVFPHVALLRVTDGADLLALGSDAPIDLDPDAIDARLTGPLGRALARAGVRDALDLAAQVALEGDGLRAYAAGAPLNRDDDGFVEHGAARAAGLEPPERIPEHMAAHAGWGGRGLDAGSLARVALRQHEIGLPEAMQAVERAIEDLGAPREAAALAALREGRTVERGPSFAEAAAAGLEALLAGRAPEAAALLSAAYEQVPDVMVRDALALALASGPDPARALRLLERVDATTCVRRGCLAGGRALRAVGRPAEAIAWLESGARLSLGDAALAIEQARALEAMDRGADALAWWSIAADRARIESGAHRRQGERARVAGDLARARSACGRALYLWPRSGPAARCVLRAACDAGDEAAIDALDAAIALALPGDVEIQTFRLARHGAAAPEALAAALLRLGGPKAVERGLSAAGRACALLGEVPAPRVGGR